MAPQLDYDQKKISFTVDSRKSENINLKSKGSLEPFSNTNSAILWHFLSNNNQINLYQKN